MLILASANAFAKEAMIPVNEKPKGQTVDYDKLIQAWREGRVK